MRATKRSLIPAAPVLLALAIAFPAAAQVKAPPAPASPQYPSEIPARVVDPTYGFDHERREVMIPMRDGVRLHTGKLSTEP